MKPLTSIYSAVTRTRNILYDRKLLSAHRLQGPVVSIGNLSVGGSGKTPFVILLGELLRARSIKFDVLSRGYGRRTRGVLQVNPNGAAAEFGDEPLLIARRLEVPVFVGASRFEAGRLAERTLGPQLHILDDGFQHRALARDFDIVMLNESDVRGRMLPSGRMREPLSSLVRADAAVISDADLVEGFPIKPSLVWRISRGIDVSAAPSRPIVFCGIARPQRFSAELKAAGIEPVASINFRDHHSYIQRDIDALLRLRDQHPGSQFVATEKDAINLAGLRAQLEPLAVVPVTMKLHDAANALDTMLRIISKRKPAA